MAAVAGRVILFNFTDVNHRAANSAEPCVPVSLKNTWYSFDMTEARIKLTAYKAYGMIRCS